MTGDRTSDAAARARRIDETGRAVPEPSLAKRFGQIGVLGWIIVAPVLLGLVAGHAIDRRMGGGIMFSAAFLMSGAALGLWLAIRWMHDQ